MSIKHKENHSFRWRQLAKAGLELNPPSKTPRLRPPPSKESPSGAQPPV